MNPEHWLVVRCAACQQCSGHRSTSGRCPHCGQRFTEDAEVVCEVESTASLRSQVALANTPEHLRERLREMIMDNSPLIKQDDGAAPHQMLQWIRALADESGAVSRSDVADVCQRKGSESDPDALMAQAELEGLVIRQGDGRWMFLE